MFLFCSFQVKVSFPACARSSAENPGGRRRARAPRWPEIKIAAAHGLVDVGEKKLPEGGRSLAKPYSPRTRRGAAPTNRRKAVFEDGD